MAYESIDKLQNILASSVFKYAKDSKKASGRALGTFVESITFYLLESWGFSNHLTIEKGLIEFGNDSISHNVEYTLHPIKNKKQIIINSVKLPVTSSKIFSLYDQFFEPIQLNSYIKKNNILLSANKVLRNSCIIGTMDNFNLMAIIDKYEKNKLLILP